jgi:hypothetical protein
MTWPSQLSDNSTCVSFGLSDDTLTAARAAVNLPQHYDVESETTFLPIFSSCPDCAGTAAASTYTAAVIWIHGLSGDANSYYCAGTSSIEAAGAESTTLSIAPWFGDTQVSLSEWGGTGTSNTSSYWTTSRARLESSDQL